MIFVIKVGISVEKKNSRWRIRHRSNHLLPRQGTSLSKNIVCCIFFTFLYQHYYNWFHNCAHISISCCHSLFIYLFHTSLNPPMDLKNHCRSEKHQHPTSVCWGKRVNVIRESLFICGLLSSGGKGTENHKNLFEQPNRKKDTLHASASILHVEWRKGTPSYFSQVIL